MYLNGLFSSFLAKVAEEREMCHHCDSPAVKNKGTLLLGTCKIALI